MSANYAILLLEDEPLIRMDLEFAAEDMGCKPFCAGSVAEAMEHLENGAAIQVAVLDVTLADNENCLPVALALDKRGIPYVLHSGELDTGDARICSLGRKQIPKPSDSRLVIREAVSLIVDDAARSA